MEETFMYLYERVERGDRDEKSVGWTWDQAELTSIRYPAAFVLRRVHISQDMDWNDGNYQSRHVSCEILTPNHLEW
jgi:hypothetical protein